jgi:hypothetical protein
MLAARSLLFAAAAFFFVTLDAQAVQVKDCSAGTSEFAVRSLTFSPDPAIRGQNGTLESVYEVPVTVDAGTARYSCTLNGLPVFDQTDDLCTQTACPILAGLHDDFSISSVPDTAGKVSCKIVWLSVDGNQLLCIQMILQLAAETNTTQKQNLRHRPRIPFAAPHLEFGIVFADAENGTCARVDDYDPYAPEYEPVSDSSSSSSSAEYKAVALRGSDRSEL